MPRDGAWALQVLQWGGKGNTPKGASGSLAPSEESAATAAKPAMVKPQVQGFLALLTSSESSDEEVVTSATPALARKHAPLLQSKTAMGNR